MTLEVVREERVLKRGCGCCPTDIFDTLSSALDGHPLSKCCLVTCKTGLQFTHSCAPPRPPLLVTTMSPLHVATAEAVSSSFASCQPVFPGRMCICLSSSLQRLPSVTGTSRTLSAARRSQHGWVFTALSCAALLPALHFPDYALSFLPPGLLVCCSLYFKHFSFHFEPLKSDMLWTDCLCYVKILPCHVVA